MTGSPVQGGGGDGVESRHLSNGRLRLFTRDSIGRWIVALSANEDLSD
jgi:hypothetical protein